MTEVVKNDRVVSRFGQQTRQCTTYVPGPSGHQDLHKKDCPFANNLGNLESITVGRSQIGGNPAVRGPQNLQLAPQCHPAVYHGTAEHRGCLAPRSQHQAGGFLPRIDAVRSFCRVPWMRSGEALMSGVCNTHNPHRAADSVPRIGALCTGASRPSAMAMNTVLWLSPLACVFVSLQPGLAIGRSQTLRLGKSGPSLPRSTGGTESEQRATHAPAPFALSGYASFVQLCAVWAP
jgi:hypothetical protein